MLVADQCQGLRVAMSSTMRLAQSIAASLLGICAIAAPTLADVVWLWDDEAFYPLGTARPRSDVEYDTEFFPPVPFGLPTQPRSNIVHDKEFFPSAAFGLSPRLRSDVKYAAFLERWFGGQLAAMEELTLWTDEQRLNEATTVRLLFLPSFDHGTMLRLTISESGEMTYVFKQLSGFGGYEPGLLAASEGGTVDLHTAAGIAELLLRVRQQPGRAPKADDGTLRICFDGTQTVIEIAGQGEYSAFERHECEMPKDDPIRRLIESMNDASGGRVIAPHTFDPDSGGPVPELGIEWKF